MIILSSSAKILNVLLTRHLSQIPSLNPVLKKCPDYMIFCRDYEAVEPSLAENVLQSMQVYHDFISETEEKSLFDEIDPLIKQSRYEFDHWDDAIHGYRETEKIQFNKSNTEIINRVRKLAFPPDKIQLNRVHVLDLEKTGYIKPHIDAVRYCGDTIAGLSLLTDSIMRLVNDKDKRFHVDILLKRRSLYVMRDAARYEYTHEILSNDNSVFNGCKVTKDRRISVICRNEPDPKYTKL